MSPGIDQRVRLTAFEFLKGLQNIHGELLPREKLVKGFLYEDRRVPLMGPQGIFKPAILPEIPISITTSPVIEGRSRPYEDSIDYGGYLRYRYRGTNPQHHENIGLRSAMTSKTPLIYFHGIAKSLYLAFWPVFIVGDDPRTLTFTVVVDQPQQLAAAQESFSTPEADARRRYCTVEVQQRVHQQGFRHRVLKAYRETCAICRLKHTELLEAAHILPDGHPKGEPTVVNGISLCNIHHAAYDKQIIGIRPDYRVVVREDVLKEVDGPMLLHGLQGFNNSKLILPARKSEYPNPEFLAERFAEFKAS